MGRWALLFVGAAALLCRGGGELFGGENPLVTSVVEIETAIVATATHEGVVTLQREEYPIVIVTGEPEGCLRPPDDMTRFDVNGRTLSVRTLAMLSHAADLYGGVIDIEGRAITQGSYTDGEPLSFGTHAGGGAVDISVVKLPEWEILWDEMEPLIRALRVAGFAAWVRQPDELGPYSPIHIHAIAIGDPELSAAAEDQLTGVYGYFRGYNGLPQESGIPIADPHGGPVVCEWMLEFGYADLRAEGDD